MPENYAPAVLPQTEDEVAEFRWEDFLPSGRPKGKRSFSIVDEATCIVGKYITKSAFIQGSIEGLVFAEEVTIEKTGSVNGFIFCRTLCIHGRVHANIICDSIVVRENGVVQANLKYKSLKIMPGGKVTGNLEARVPKPF